MPIQPYTPDDAEALSALQMAYAQAYPGAQVVPAEWYAHPGFEQGANVLCARDDSGTLLAYAPLFPPPPGASSPTLWCALRYDPGHPAAKGILSALWDALQARARALAPRWLGQQPVINVELAASEQAVTAVLEGQGWQTAYHVYGMARDLAAPLPDAAAPQGVFMALSPLRAPEEQATWLEAHNACFPAAPWTEEGLHHLLELAIWPSGTVIVARKEGALVGALQLYADPQTLSGAGPRRALTEEIFVLPGWRKQGVASAMIALALGEARARGYASAALEVSAQNITALGLYRRLGYEIGRDQVVLTRPL